MFAAILVRHDIGDFFHKYIVRHGSRPTHSTETFPDAKDVNTITSARTALIDARKLLHEIRKQLVDGIGDSSVHNKPRGVWSSAQSNWKQVKTLARYADSIADHRRVELPTASTASTAAAERLMTLDELKLRNLKRTQSEQLLLDELNVDELNDIMGSMPPVTPLPDEEVMQKRNEIASTQHKIKAKRK